ASVFHLRSLLAADRFEYGLYLGRLQGKRCVEWSRLLFWSDVVALTLRISLVRPDWPGTSVGRDAGVGRLRSCVGYTSWSSAARRKGRFGTRRIQIFSKVSWVRTLAANGVGSSARQSSTLHLQLLSDSELDELVTTAAHLATSFIPPSIAPDDVGGISGVIEDYDALVFAPSCP
ncbi:hypothetical protein K438DRAFT_2027746, partial [Mycena galopus ATCC 62051]